MSAFPKPSRHRETCRNVLIGILAPVLLWGAVVWAATAYGNALGSPYVSTDSPAPAETVQQAGKQDFVSAWSRLDSALAHHGYQNAQTILRRVRDENAARGVSVCNFEWNQGQVSLVFGQNIGDENAGQPMGRDMSNCATAVEKEESGQ